MFVFPSEPTKNAMTMKSNKLHFFCGVLLLFFFISFSFGQGSAPVVITLTVDASKLGNDRNDPGGCTLSAIPASVVIYDAGDPKSFTIEVEQGTDIEWEGITTDGTPIDIKKIVRKGGTNVFNTRGIDGKPDRGRDKVKAKIMHKTAPGKDYSYKIRFNGKDFGNYRLDPKIKVR
jgi:hypothetical protein